MKWCLIGAILCSVSIHAQTDTIYTAQIPGTVSNKAFYWPAGLIATGIVMDMGTLKEDFRDWALEDIGRTQTKVDDYLQYAPIALMYAGDAICAVGADETWRQTRHMLVSQAATLGIIYTIKYVLDARRPNGGRYSMPSGHTAFSFSGATVLHQSFKDSEPLLAWSGYAAATMVGSLRVLKDKHWISDVLIGAGIGIGMAQLTYHLDIWHARGGGPHKRGAKSTAMYLDIQSSGLSVALRF